jgi:hypothetical protein
MGRYRQSLAVSTRKTKYFSHQRHEMTIIMSWYRITLSRQEYESGEVSLLMGAFRAAYIAKNGPEGMAMLGGWNEDGSDYLVYTSPRAARYIIPLLDAYSAKKTNTPDMSSLSLIYGDESGLSSVEIGFEA